MIDTDETGQKKLDEVRKSSGEMNDWEQEFLDSIGNKPYNLMTPKQKSTVGRLHDKLVGK